MDIMRNAHGVEGRGNRGGPTYSKVSSSCKLGNASTTTLCQRGTTTSFEGVYPPTKSPLVPLRLLKDNDHDTRVKAASPTSSSSRFVERISCEAEPLVLRPPAPRPFVTETDARLC